MTAKRLYRSRKNKVIAGVCGGLADYFNADPTLIRLIFAALLFFEGTGALLYFLMMIVVPKEKLTYEHVENGASVGGTGGDSGREAKSAEGEAGTSATASGFSKTVAAEPETVQVDSGALAALWQREDEPVRANDMARAYWVGLACVALGMYFFIAPYLPQLRFDFLLGISLVSLGVFIAFRKV